MSNGTPTGGYTLPCTVLCYQEYHVLYFASPHLFIGCSFALITCPSGGSSSAPVTLEAVTRYSAEGYMLVGKPGYVVADDSVPPLQDPKCVAFCSTTHRDRYQPLLRLLTAVSAGGSLHTWCRTVQGTAEGYATGATSAVRTGTRVVLALRHMTASSTPPSSTHKHCPPDIGAVERHTSNASTRITSRMGACRHAVTPRASTQRQPAPRTVLPSSRSLQALRPPQGRC